MIGLGGASLNHCSDSLSNSAHISSTPTGYDYQNVWTELLKIMCTLRRQMIVDCIGDRERLIQRQNAQKIVDTVHLLWVLFHCCLHMHCTSHHLRVRLSCSSEGSQFWASPTWPHKHGGYGNDNLCTDAFVLTKEWQTRILQRCVRASTAL